MELIKDFGGERSEEYNALGTALRKAAQNMNMELYDYLEETPKTSLTVEITNALHELGFKICPV